MTIRSFPIPRGRFQVRVHSMWLARARQFGIDWSVLILIFGVYFLLRGLAPVDEGFAMNVTGYLIDFEKATYTFWEPQVQAVSIHWYAVREVANFIYAYMHFPALAGIGLWLWFRERERFVFTRNVIYISMVIGLVFYYLVPAAPPRLLALHGQDLGFTDTIFGGNTAVSYAQPSLILNDYAAMPSFHFGWIALASAAVWANSTRWWLRAFGILLSVLMSWAIVATANHFFIDMILGGVIIAISWYLARVIELRAGRALSEAEHGETRVPAQAPTRSADRA